jgi:hypothetical protein
VLVIRQDRYEVQSDLRAPGGWVRVTLNSPNGELVLPAFWLRCALRTSTKERSVRVMRPPAEPLRT